MQVAAQINIYPLRQERLSPAIEGAWEALGSHNVTVDKDGMSTVVLGEEEEVFAAVREGFRAAASLGPVSMVVTFSNACPVWSRGVSE